VPLRRPSASAGTLVARVDDGARTAQRKHESRSIPEKNAILFCAEKFPRAARASRASLAPRRCGRPAGAAPKNISAKWLTSKNHVISFRPADTTAEASHHEPADNSPHHKPLCPGRCIGGHRVRFPGKTVPEKYDLPRQRRPDQRWPGRFHERRTHAADQIPGSASAPPRYAAKPLCGGAFVTGLFPDPSKAN
jgi:hypothetical protein